MTGAGIMSGAMSPTAIVLHGPTSAGKSSIARALQASAPLPKISVMAWLESPRTRASVDNVAAATVWYCWEVC
jgi:chloramphenicol 3-O-phosphotransferase